MRERDVKQEQQRSEGQDPDGYLHERSEVLDEPALPRRFWLKENVLHVILVDAERQISAHFVEGARDPVGAKPVLELVPKPRFQSAVRRPQSGFLPWGIGL